MNAAVRNIINLIGSKDERNKEIAFSLLAGNTHLVQMKQVQLLLVWYKSYALYNSAITPLLKYIDKEKVQAIEEGVYIFKLRRFVFPIDKKRLEESFEKYKPFHLLLYEAMQYNSDYIYSATSVIDLLVEKEYQLHFAREWYKTLYEENRLPVVNQIRYALFIYEQLMSYSFENYRAYVQDILNIVEKGLSTLTKRNQKDLYLLRASLYCTFLNDSSRALINFEKGLIQGYASGIDFENAAWLLYHHTTAWDIAYVYAQKAINKIYFRRKAYYILAVLKLHHKKDRKGALELFGAILEREPEDKAVLEILKELEEIP